MSRKCTVSAERNSARPSESTNCTAIGSGRNTTVQASLPFQASTPSRIGSPSRKCARFAITVTIGSTSAGKQHLLDQVAARDDDARGLTERGREPGPRQDAAEEEDEVGLDVGRLAHRQHVGEDEPVGREQQQRVDEAPQEAEQAAAVAGLQLARDQAADEGAEAEQGADLGEHRGAAGLVRRRARAGRRRVVSPRARRRGGPRRSPPRLSPGAGAPRRAVVACSARPTSMSSARSPISASTLTRSGSTSHQPEKQVNRCQAPSCAVGQLAEAERGHQRRVAGPHAEVALRAGRHHLVDLVPQQQPLGRDDLERDLGRQGHRSPSVLVLHLLGLLDHVLDRTRPCRTPARAGGRARRPRSS